MRRGGKLVGLGVLTAIAASLCCITPVLALLAGTSSLATTFSWIEPFRPYLLGITILVLGFAWYQKLKPTKVDECGCEVDQKPRFMQSKLFLGIVTVFAILMMTFPSYSYIFYPEVKSDASIVSEKDKRTVVCEVEGMTCESCSEHINRAVNQVEGIANVSTSYENGTSIVEFDRTRTNLEEIVQAIDETGYTVTGTKKTE